MASRKKKLIGSLGAAAFRLFQWYVERKSPQAGERAGERLGRLAYRVMKSRRARTLSNLQLAFPELSDAQREGIAKGTFEHFGRIAADFLRSAKRSKEETLASIEVEGREHIENAVKNGKGALLMTGHFGNWELIAHWLTATGYDTWAVARDPNGREMSELVLKQREASGLKVLPRGNAARTILACVKKNGIVGILFDQNTSEAFLPFFGHPCGTVIGPAVLSQRSGSPLVPVYCVRVAPMKYRLVFEAPVQPAEGYEGPEAYTKSMNEFLERAIRQYPDQYLWLHDRWKSARQKGML